ncbi:MAG: hypothetical protein EBT03_13460, partial [Betaproteobacteria bacterium]|nr:hypothetical protein [Betaproteobacteria bacterium]
TYQEAVGVSQTLTVNKKTLTVTAANQSKTYGQTNPALTFSYSGFVTGESASNLPTAPTASTTATTGSSVGTYPITLAGGVSDNYDFNYVGGTLTVSSATLASTNINFNPPASTSYSGSGIGYTATSGGVSGFNYSYSGRNGTSYGPSATAPTAVGDYTVTATSSDPNYTGSRTFNYSITKATLTPVFSGTTNRVWNGSAQTLSASTTPSTAVVVGYGMPLATSGGTNIAHNGSAQFWTVPAGVTNISVTLTGAKGGRGANDGSGTGGNGGSAGQVTGSVAVTPGEVLTVLVGGAGADGAYGQGTGGGTGGMGGFIFNGGSTAYNLAGGRGGNSGSSGASG